MSDKTYAQFNTLTITGRVSHTEVVEKDGDKWVSVTLLSELVNDAASRRCYFQQLQRHSPSG